jgi:hypothetical protein
LNENFSCIYVGNLEALERWFENLTDGRSACYDKFTPSVPTSDKAVEGDLFVGWDEDLGLRGCYGLRVMHDSSRSWLDGGLQGYRDHLRAFIGS